MHLWCPACNDLHPINVGPGGWTWNGDTETPDVNPSIKVTGVQWEPGDPFHMARHSSVPVGDQTVCHSFLRSGEWQFLTDSTHDLAGQTVPAVDLPDFLLHRGDEATP